MPDSIETDTLDIIRLTARPGRPWRFLRALGVVFRPAAKTRPATRTRPCFVRSELQAMMMVTRDIGPYVRKASDRLHDWSERRSQRRKLMALDDRMIGDIGISRADAEEEHRKPFWR